MFGPPTSDLDPVLMRMIRRELNAILERFRHRPSDDELRRRIMESVQNEIRRMVDCGDVPSDYCRHAFTHDKMRGALHLYVVRDYRYYPMTGDDFHDFFRRAPAQDDLHRINCREAGTLGHWHCGWCMRHETARWDCGCVVAEEAYGAGGSAW